MTDSLGTQVAITEEITNVAVRYLQPILKQKIDSLILGCSHYPLITPILTEILPSNIKLIDPAEALSLKLKLFLDSKTSDFENKEYLVDSKFYVTSDPDIFSIRAKHWLNVFPEVKLVSLQKKGCVS